MDLMDNWKITASADLKNPQRATSMPRIQLIHQDSMAHRIEVSVFDGNNIVDLANAGVVCYFQRSDGTTVLCSGSAEGNVAKATLVPECYAIPGAAHAIMRMSIGDMRISIGEWFFNVGLAFEEDVVVPGGSPIQDVESLLAYIEQLEALKGSMNEALDTMDDFRDDIVRVQNEQPTSDDNRIWVPLNNAEEVEIPDMGDINGLREDVAAIEGDLSELNAGFTEINQRVAAIEAEEGLHRYGVAGIGLSNARLTRLYDSVGMTAQVGTDGDNSGVVNNFDDVAPFNRRKCVGEWVMYNGKPVFRVNAYYGDPDYTEDGSMGDYVAVDCTPAYYRYDVENGELVISAHHYNGYRPFDCLADRETGECRPHTYLPCYALATIDGHAVSLPGLRNEQGNYADLFDICKTANNDAADHAMLMPIAVNFYEWAMFTVEFATTNCQTIMQGCASLRHNNDDLIIMSSATEGILQNHQAARVVGEYVSVQPDSVDINNAAWLASHRITSIERCDQDGTPNESGAYDHVILEAIDDTRTVESGTTYRFAARPYNTGACNGVSTPSGSPVSNANGCYPMKYRWRENVYGNQYQTVVDLMNYAVLEDGFTSANANFAAHLEWYYHRTPETLTPTNYSNNAAGRDAMIAAGWELLDMSTPAEDYINGYIKSRDHSNKYPDVWKPGVTAGASSGTYFADYAFLVSSSPLRAVRVGGNWNSGSNDGFSYAIAYNAPASGFAFFGGSLYYPQ